MAGEDRGLAPIPSLDLHDRQALWRLPRRAYGVEVVGAGLSGGGGELTGIDYLGLIAVAYRRQWHRQF
jgi:hypothetical protein